MNALSLVSHHLCPFVQRAAIVLGEKGIAFDRINVDLSEKPEWFLKKSPTGKVPLLIASRPDGGEAVLFETTVICEFLEESQEGTPMHPSNAFDRARDRAWAEYISSMYADVWLMLNANDMEVFESKKTTFRAKIGQIEGEASSGPYFNGKFFSMVDAAMAPLSRFFDCLPADRTTVFFEYAPKIEKWRQTLMSRPSVAAAVGADYAVRFREQLSRQHALILQ
ncbi:glutathione S-transferase [Paraburkholderia sp. HC6.4b]|uniref:glutathione S-transferase family protein n=1 Tax=unclassified Paraburkholderia TaxID=2615204 RepID=UPI001617BC34|nr:MULTISPECIES: glutathione S-transferase family protein [unclassified Paraburkholderia]MBB5406411.1 glutathione S-transferase [Paraburkholderia sp. HC6.4b]MBB5448809.1 glutathione S-transferase [Paraburkholderia sp. Kb1A]